MGVTAQYMHGYVTKRRRLKRHYATIAAIISAAGSAIGSAAAGTAAGAAAAGSGIASGLGAAGSAIGSAASAIPGLVGGALTGTGSGVGGAIGSGALGSAGTGALGGAIPAGVSFSGPSAALGASEVAAMLPTAMSTPASFGGAAIPALGAGPPVSAPASNFSSMLGSGLDFMSNPGGNLGGQVGKMFGNEKLGSQIGNATQAVMKGNEKPQQSGVPMPAQALSIAAPQAPPLPGMGSAMGGSGPSFHVNPQTGVLEYS
jgi:hypothetical protein